METAPKDLVVSSEEANLMSILHSMWKHRCIAVILGLKIPDLLCNTDKPSLSIEEIAEETGCQTSIQLYAVMRLLSQCGIGKELDNKHFAKNESMELLRCDKGPSIGHVFVYHSSEEHISALGSLESCVKQGVPAFVLKHRMDHCTYMNDLKKEYAGPPRTSPEHNVGSEERRKQFAETFNNAVSYYCYLVTLPDKPGVNNTYRAFPWSTCNKLVDIGGSLGSFLACILKLPGCEHIQGYVLEYPDVVEEAKSKIQDLGIPEHRIQFVKQDLTLPYSEDLDLQVDTVICKSTISIYMGDHSLVRKILSNCRKLFPTKGGRLLIIDHLVPEDKNEKVGINGMETGSQSIHWLSISGSPYFTKKDWKEQMLKVGIKELGYEVSTFFDTFAGGETIIELLYKPQK